ncbi:MAG: alpha-xylosidase [Bacteroidales bacterium]|nr:alpha-xylosidase [Bacteroidales bacterium]
MRQTNYQLFDFLDFDPALNQGERLWRACRPTDIREKEGCVYITVPFQQQHNSNEITEDTGVPRQDRQIRLKAYGDKIIRLTACLDPETGIHETSEMLQLKDLDIQPLHVEKESQKWLVKDQAGRLRALVNFEEPATQWWSDLQPAPAETMDLRLWPDGQKEVRLSAYDMFSPARHDAFAMAYVTRDGQPQRATCAFHAQPGECFYGTGERFAKMDLSGRTLQLYNQDGQGVNNRRTYKNIPFYLSSEGYGLFLHTTYFAKFSLADHSTRSAQLLVDEPVIDCFVIGGDTPERILYGYRQLTGFPAMPPLWSFGTWMSRMTYFSADEVNEICDRMRAEGYPCDVIHLDTGWFKTDWLCEWKFNEQRFPDPKGFIQRLKQQGYRVSLWQLPYISYDAAQYKEASENHYISQSPNKIQGASNFSVQDYAGTIDFTYDKATEWYKGLLKSLLDMGVACIKTDFGEDIHMDAKYHRGTPREIRNIYSLLYQKAAYEITKEVTGQGIVWARSAWAGCQRYPLHWGGDSASSWDGMAGSLKGGLHFGLSGFGFWSHDVPGFHSVPNFMNTRLSDGVYVRWTQFGVFSSHLRYHGSFKREPWHYPAIAPIVKKWLQLRYRLIPYIVKQAEKTTQTGYPMLRAMYLMYPDDLVCRHLDSQYFFGDDFLVAPVMNSENKATVYLPEGRWVNFFTKEVFEGPLWLKDITVPLEEMPVYVRQGASIPMYPEDVACTDQMDLGKSVMIKF